METLPPNGYFDPTSWLYEQICLALPQRQLCDDSCPGIEVPQTASDGQGHPLIDDRWSALAQLQRQIGQNSEPESVDPRD